MGVATAVAIGGLALSAGQTVMSFTQAGKQKNKQREAEAAASAAMAEARKKLSINYTDELAVNKEPYELQREALLSQGAQAIQAGQESERGAVATAGKVMMAQNEAQAGIRTAMGAEMTDIQKQQIAEDSRLRDLGAQLDLEEAAGQQMIAQNAEEAAAAQTQQGMQGLMSVGQQGLGMVPLFAKTGASTNDAFKYDKSKFNAIDTPNMQNQFKASVENPLGTTRQFTGQNGIIPPQFSGTFKTYGQGGITPQPNVFGPQMPPQPGTQYGMLGVDFSGVGY